MAKLHAIESTTASLQVPSVGWRQIYLLLCTIPAEWKPGSPIDAAALQSVAMSRQQRGSRMSSADSLRFAQEALRLLLSGTC